MLFVIAGLSRQSSEGELWVATPNGESYEEGRHAVRYAAARPRIQTDRDEGLDSIISTEIVVRGQKAMEAMADNGQYDIVDCRVVCMRNVANLVEVEADYVNPTPRARCRRPGWNAERSDRHAGPRSWLWLS